MNKKGISVVSISVTIVILLVIASTISVSITNSPSNAKKLTFAKEIYNVQNLVTEYIQKENVLPSSNETIQIKPSDLEQFEVNKERITDGKVLLNVLDLSELDIVNTNYGNKQIGETAEEKEKDVYAVSQDTGRVYYIAGFKDNNKTYYTLTDDLLNMIEKNQNLLIGEKTIIFTPSKLGWSNEAVSVKVTVPNTYQVENFKIDNENIKYVKETAEVTTSYTVNSEKVLENYEITIDYTKDGAQKSIKYKTKLDLTKPVISKDDNISNTTSAIKGLNAIDEESGIKQFKYVEGIINDANAKDYVILYGKNVNKGSIKMKTKSVYTLYAEDKAGNGTVMHLDGDGQRFYPTIATPTGTNQLVLTNSYNLRLINCRIYGNSVQNGTPSIDTPVEVQSVGELVNDESDANYGKYKIPITVSGKNLFDLEKLTILEHNGKYAEIQTDRVKVYNNYALQRTIYKFTAQKDVALTFSYECEDETDDYYGYTWIMTDEKTIYNVKSGHVLNLVKGDNITIAFAVHKRQSSYVYTGEEYVTFKNIQLEEGTVATPYEPYVEPVTANIYLNEPLRKVGEYVDYVDFEEECVVRHVGESKFDGSEEWQYAGEGEINERFMLNLGLVQGIGYCNVGNVGTEGWNQSEFKIQADSVGLIRFYRPFYAGIITTEASLQNWKQYLADKSSAGNPVTLTYALTNKSTQKVDLPEIKLNYGTNIISIGTTIAPSQTDITYYRKP